MKGEHWRELAVLAARLTAGVGVAVPAFAQCPDAWTPGGLRRGFNGAVLASTLWDPDGPGPAPEMLVVGGQFTIAGNAAAPYLAAWDGAAWHAIPGLDGRVWALAVWNGVLVAGGDFVTAGGRACGHIAAWDGSAWHTFDAGFNNTVNALGVYHGELYAGGSFTASGGTPAYAARWDGAAWQGLSPGVNNSVGAFFVYQDQLVVGGAFDHVGSAWCFCVAMWNGSALLPIGPDRTHMPFVHAISTLGTDLVVAGVYGDSTVYRWDGTNWFDMGDGLTPLDPTESSNDVTALIHSNGDFLAGSSWGLSRWTGGRWEQLPDFAANGGIEAPSVVTSMLVYQGDLIAGGRFQRVDRQVINSLARQSGPDWVPMVNGASVSRILSVSAILRDGTDVIVGGRLALTDSGFDTGGGAARWDGASWHAMPGLRIDQESLPLVSALATYGQSMYAAGQFVLDGTPGQVGLARWDGGAWRGVEGIVCGEGDALVEFQGSLIAAGAIGLNSMNVKVARFDGASWQPMPDPPGPAYSLAVLGGSLYAGGNLYPSSSSGYVARWNGAGWETIGAWPGQKVLCMTSYAGQVVAGGWFDFGYASIGAARWDGSAWVRFGTDLPQMTTAVVWAMAADSQGLYLGGFTSYVGGFDSILERWDGASLQAIEGLGAVGPPGSGLDIYALLRSGSELWVGGRFDTAAGQDSPFLARYGPGAPSCYPNCDCSSVGPVLNVYDFLCFLSRFANGDPYANCDGSTVAPVLNVNDFICFQTRFAGGCR